MAHSKLGRRMLLSRGELIVGAAALAGGLLLPGCGPGPMDDELGGGGDPGFGPGSDEQLETSAKALHTPACEETEDNIEGPFYRPDAPFRARIASPSDGVPLIIHGQVQGLDGACIPLEGALVDVWQANAEGDYDRTSPDFHWRGRSYTGVGGGYRVETIVPGRYLNGDQFRPRHIHFKFSAEGFTLLTTQLYFRGDSYLANDPFVHPKLVRPVSWNGSAYSVNFPIVLAKA